MKMKNRGGRNWKRTANCDAAATAERWQSGSDEMQNNSSKYSEATAEFKRCTCINNEEKRGKTSGGNMIYLFRALLAARPSNQSASAPFHRFIRSFSH